MPKKGYKQTEEHRKKIGLASAIFNKGKKANANQLRALAEGTKLAHLNAHNRKPFLGKHHTEETKQKIKNALKKAFPEGRQINDGCFKQGALKIRTGKSCKAYHKWAREIMEKQEGRKLEFNEVVHHINGNWMDNSIENLIILSRPEHSRIHHKRVGM